MSRIISSTVAGGAFQYASHSCIVGLSGDTDEVTCGNDWLWTRPSTGLRMALFVKLNILLKYKV